MNDADARLATVARRQYGLVTRRDALAVMSRRQLERRIESGTLVRDRPKVYRVVGAPETWPQTVLSACLAAGPGAYASHRTAAALWSLAGFEHEDAIHVTTPSRRRRRLTEVVVHDTEVLGRRHTVTRRGIPMSTPARTLCDLTSCCTPPEVERALDDALRRKLLTLRALAAVHRDVAGPGRRRSTVMRALLDERLPGFDPGGSPKERELVEWIVGAGLPPPVPQHRVRVGRRSFRLDLAYPDLLIGIEYDGWDAHRARSTFATDRARQNELEVRGWLVLRFTASSTRDDVVRSVTSAIDSRRSTIHRV